MSNWLRLVGKYTPEIPVGLLTISILVSFHRGDASVTNPDWWAYHKIWVWHLSMAGAAATILAWFAGKPRGHALLWHRSNFQMSLQYIFVHRALDGDCRRRRTACPERRVDAARRNPLALGWP